MTEFPRIIRSSLLAAMALTAAATAFGQARPAVRPGDHIVAVVNNELVTAFEVRQRVERAREEARRTGQRLPPADELQRQIVEGLIDERAVLTYAREVSAKVDEAELERAVSNVAAQNQLSAAQLRDRLKKEGIDYTRFRANVRDQLMVERVREREVASRLKVSDLEVDNLVAQRRSAQAGGEELNIAQILVTLPDGADEATVAARQALARRALARVRGGEDFAAVAREMSQDLQRESGGEIGLRPASRLPDLFVESVRALKPGDVVAEPVRSGAGFHVLKLLQRVEGGGFTVTQTRVRHILIRPSEQLSVETATRRLEAMRRQVEAGQRSFEALARENSEDGSAPSGGDLGWVSPGAFVPEFEEAMNSLAPGAMSAPVASRFGLHLIQVVERREATLDMREVREQARNALREQKFEQAYLEWVRDLRAKAYVEMREPPQ